MEAHAQHAKEAKSELDHELRHSAALEAYVETLQAALQHAAQRTQELEERAAAGHGAGAVARQAAALASPKEVQAVTELAEEANGSAGLDETATGAPSSARSSKTLEDSAFDSEGHAEPAASEPPQAPREHLVDCHSPPVVDCQSPPVTGVSPSPETPQQNAQEQAQDQADPGQYLEDLWDFVVQGPPVKEKEQPDFAQKSIACFPSDALERLQSRGIACLCVRGHRLDAMVPNQDDFLLAVRAPVRQGHVALYGVFDGHGPTGHLCAAFARSFLPECIFSDTELFSRPKAVLKRAFAQTQQALLQQPFNVQVSGTTATLTLIVDSRAAGGSMRAYVAHIGDSRVILASRKEEDSDAFVLTTLTREHRPDDPEEETRVKSQGGEIRKFNSGAGAGRVFVPGRSYPALPLTRTLGVAMSAECGVLSEPEITSHRLKPGCDLLLVLGTDGLFEFCASQDVAAPLLEHGVSMATLEEICCLSRERWAANSYNHTVDDTTAVAVSLLTHFG